MLCVSVWLCYKNVCLYKRRCVPVYVVCVCVIVLRVCVFIGVSLCVRCVCLCDCVMCTCMCVCRSVCLYACMYAYVVCICRWLYCMWFHWSGIHMDIIFLYSLGCSQSSTCSYSWLRKVIKMGRVCVTI